MTDSSGTTRKFRSWHPQVQQQVFRKLVRAYSFPGRPVSFDPLGVKEAPLALILACLLDGETTLSDPDEMLDHDAWLRLTTHRKTPDQAAYVLVSGAHPPQFTPTLGSLESPELGATLLLLVQQLGAGLAMKLHGPGISGKRKLKVSGLDPAWIEHRQKWNGSFPMGVDCLLVDGNAAVALPRTTQIELPELA